jgi:dephospho-CoA kinase
MLKIGLTGGIGSGKSYIAAMFEALGVPVYEADIEAKRLMRTQTDLINGIRGLFGDAAYSGDELNTACIADSVFRDKQKLAALNALVHPAVHRDFSAWSEQQVSADYVIEAAALLFESGGHRQLDYVVFVRADRDLRIDRVMRRDGTGREDVEARISNQMPDPLKEQQADYIIDNNGERMILPQVINVHRIFIELNQKQHG